MALFLVSVAVALFVSACCSLMEAVLLSLTPSQIGEVALRHPRVGATWQHFKANIERPIAAILILNTAAHTIGAAVAGAQFNQLFGDEWIVVVLARLHLPHAAVHRDPAQDRLACVTTGTSPCGSPDHWPC